jgi:hypothetical protein
VQRVVYKARIAAAGSVRPQDAAVGKAACSAAYSCETPWLQISRDRKYLHMTTGHGSPDGKYWKYELGPDTLVGAPIFLGNFPASIDVTPDGLYARSP